MDHDIVEAKRMKAILCAFGEVSGLKINFHKSELFCFGLSSEEENKYSELFGCSLGRYPFKYLGIPMHYKKLLNADWKVVEHRFEKKLSSWKGKHLSVGGRLVLIESVLSSLAMFMMSFFEVPREVLKKLDYYRSRFFWQADGNKKKYRLTRWNIICEPKDQGGLGIKDLDIHNQCLLSKWLFKLINEEGMWQTLLKRKYIKDKTIGQLYKGPRDSHFWSGLMKVKERFLDMGSFQVNKGDITRFWEDKWLGDFKLKDRYPSLV
jgi:hypothetical protein